VRTFGRHDTDLVAKENQIGVEGIDFVRFRDNFVAWTVTKEESVNTQRRAKMMAEIVYFWHTLSKAILSRI
jgi:hypothetical protein